MENFVILIQASENFRVLIFSTTSTLFCFLSLLLFPRFWSAIVSFTSGPVKHIGNPRGSLPSGAGLFFSGVYMIAGLIFQSAGNDFLERTDLLFYLAPLFLMSAAGFFDDIYEFPWFPRLFFYFLISLCFVVVTQPSGLLSEPDPQNFAIISASLSVLVLLWITNEFEVLAA